MVLGLGQGRVDRTHSSPGSLRARFSTSPGSLPHAPNQEEHEKELLKLYL